MISLKRWCFYMNLPIGGVALVLLLSLLKLPDPKSRESAPFIEHVKRLDPIGTFFFVSSVVSLLLALQWGGATYAWDDDRIAALFVVAGVAFIAFAAVQICSPRTAQVPVPIITQRSMLAGAFFMFFLAGAMMLAVYYVPLWCERPLLLSRTTTQRVVPTTTDRSCLSPSCQRLRSGRVRHLQPSASAQYRPLVLVVGSFDSENWVLCSLHAGLFRSHGRRFRSHGHASAE